MVSFWKNRKEFWSHHRSNFWWATFGVVFGAIFGHILDKPADKVRDILGNAICNAETHLEYGLRLRKEALDMKFGDNEKDYIPDLYKEKIVQDKQKESNIEFSMAADCGSALAKAHLGQAYCFGWGVEKDRKKGINMIRDAAKNDFNISKWADDNVHCPE